MHFRCRPSAASGMLEAALTSDEASVEAALRDEEQREREADLAYWRPLQR